MKIVLGRTVHTGKFIGNRKELYQLHKDGETDILLKHFLYHEKKEAIVESYLSNIVTFLIFGATMGLGSSLLFEESVWARVFGIAFAVGLVAIIYSAIKLTLEYLEAKKALPIVLDLIVDLFSEYPALYKVQQSLDLYVGQSEVRELARYLEFLTSEDGSDDSDIYKLDYPVDLPGTTKEYSYGREIKDYNRHYPNIVFKDSSGVYTMQAYLKRDGEVVKHTQWIISEYTASHRNELKFDMEED